MTSAASHTRQDRVRLIISLVVILAAALIPAGLLIAAGVFSGVWWRRRPRVWGVLVAVGVVLTALQAGVAAWLSGPATPL